MVAPNSLSISPQVSVIVPARNEEDCLGTCLASLVEQRGIPCEIIVVDDGSTDRTRAIAQSFPDVRVVDAPALPRDWSGKNNATFAGAAAARGEWLLFTDADTVHLPGSLARSVAEAQRRHADLLSYSPEQEVHGLAEQAVMPVVFAELAVTYRPARVSDPRYSAAAANGQYLLISRAAYDAVGGHQAVATTLLEDVALARAVKQSGRNIFFRYAADAVRTRMYRSFSQLREGWTKNLVLLFPSPGWLAVQRMTEFFLIAGSAASAVILALRGDPGRALFAAILGTALWGLLLRRIRRAHFAWQATLLSLAGLPLFSYLLFRSILAHKKGRISWKGRDYGGTASPGDASPSIAAEPKPGWQAPA
jgi:glycosyltransferase involved in cell wall biosynthesis